MTRQEEIKKRLAYALAELQGQGTYCGDYFFRLADGVLKYLDENNVVIKVEGELPLYGTHQNPIPPEMHGVGRKVDEANDGMRYLADNGYVAVEPLIDPQKV